MASSKLTIAATIITTLAVLMFWRLKKRQNPDLDSGDQYAGNLDEATS